jgi:hypothetical protein
MFALIVVGRVVADADGANAKASRAPMAIKIRAGMSGAGQDKDKAFLPGFGTS